MSDHQARNFTPSETPVVFRGKSAASPRVEPIPPADNVGHAVRALNTILSQLGGAEALAALRAGDSNARVNADLFGPAFEGARNFRDHFVLNLARHTRDEWRRDVADIVANQPQFNHASKIATALEERLLIALNFAFRFLTPRHVCFLGDALTLAFEADIKPAEFSRELAAAGARAKPSSSAMLDALVVGGSGMHKYHPERVMLTAKPAGTYEG